MGTAFASAWQGVSFCEDFSANSAFCAWQQGRLRAGGASLRLGFQLTRLCLAGLGHRAGGAIVSARSTKDLRSRALFLQQRLDSVLVLGREPSGVFCALVRPLEPCFCNAVWHLRSLSARSSLGDLRSSLQVVPPRRRFWRLLARVVLVCFGVVPSLPWAISRAGSGRTGSSRRALHGPQNLLGIGDWLLLPTACRTQAGDVSDASSASLMMKAVEGVLIWPS